MNMVFLCWLWVKPSQKDIGQIMASLRWHALVIYETVRLADIPAAGAKNLNGAFRSILRTGERQVSRSGVVEIQRRLYGGEFKRCSGSGLGHDSPLAAPSS